MMPKITKKLMPTVCFRSMIRSYPESKRIIPKLMWAAVMWVIALALMTAMLKTVHQDGYTLPGGQVSFGEYSQKALAQKLMEETGAAVHIGRLAMVAELFFQWKKPCHQINFYYLAEVKNAEALPSDSFRAYDALGRERPEAEFEWIAADRLDKIKIYPSCLKPYLKDLPDHVVHLQQAEG